MRLGEIIIAPSILQSSKSFCAVNLQLILNPPSIILFCWSSGESKTIIPPKSDLTRSSITVLTGVPGETSFMKSMKVFSFSTIMVFLRLVSIYNFMLSFLNRVFVVVL